MGGHPSLKATGIRTEQNALSTSAEIVAAAKQSRSFIEIKNTDASISVYIGGDAGVLTTTGHLLKAGEAIGFEDYIGPIWAIAASGTPTITILEF